MRHRVGWLGLVAVVTAITGVLACRQLVGITDNPPEDLVTSICGLPYRTNTCASCVNTSCCSESTTCAADPVCAAYEGCLGKCNGDPACRSQCTIDNPVGTASDVSALSACLASKCETACGVTCGGVAAYVSEPASAPSCQSCLQINACDDARAWSTSVDGDAYWRCVLSCPTEDCRLTCATDNPSGASLFAPFQADYSGTCSVACAFGSYWPCVGHVTWPVAKSKTWKDTFKVVDSTSQMGVPGLDLSICTGCPCGSAAYPILQQAQTDDAGVVTWLVPQVLGAIGPGMGVGLDGCSQVTSPSMTYIPLFAYWGWPISEPMTDRASINLSISVTKPGALATLLSDVGITQDPMRGWVGAVVFDCLGSPAPGVRVKPSSNDMLMTTEYLQAVGSEVEATPRSGVVVILNVPPGLVTLTATPVALGKPSSQVNVNVAAGTETSFYMFPTQNP